MPTLDVPGATLYYEREGTGPVLLMIPGGPADGGVFAALAERLGVAPVTFPGDHGGFGSRPAEFAKTLHQLLGG